MTKGRPDAAHVSRRRRPQEPHVGGDGGTGCRARRHEKVLGVSNPPTCVAHGVFDRTRGLARRKNWLPDGMGLRREHGTRCTASNGNQLVSRGRGRASRLEGRERGFFPQQEVPGRAQPLRSPRQCLHPSTGHAARGSSSNAPCATAFDTDVRGGRLRTSSPDHERGTQRPLGS